MANSNGVVIGVGNQKGGVAKSTNTVHIGAALAEKGYRCLIIDLDPSAGSTKHLGIPTEGFLGTLELLTTDETPQSLAIGEDEGLPKNLFLIPARTELTQLDRVLSKFVDKTRLLARPLELARPDFDFILLDTPPNAGWTTTVAAYSAAEWFLLSSLPEPLSIGGLNEALKDIVDVRARVNPNLEVLGILITAVDGRSNLWREVEEVINRELPNRGFQTMISRAIEVSRLPKKGKTVFQVPKLLQHEVARQYRAVALEIEWRVRNREAFLAGKLGLPDLSGIFPVKIDDIKNVLEMPVAANG